jgi:hypothetical protein
MRSGFVVVALGAGAVAAPLALAATTTVKDARDVPASRLDLKSVTAGRAGKSVTLTLKTYKPFKTSVLAGKTIKACVYVQPAKATDRYEICVSAKGGKLRTQVLKGSSSVPLKTAARAVRAGGSGLRVTVPSQLYGTGRSYGWLAFTQDGGPINGDRVPDDGSLKTQRLR